MGVVFLITVRARRQPVLGEKNHSKIGVLINRKIRCSTLYILVSLFTVNISGPSWTLGQFLDALPLWVIEHTDEHKNANKNNSELKCVSYELWLMFSLV